jgi:sulfite reductase (NADPH) flavoprotein alpha-component
MAAMAQQDCGQCGYNCKDYADALFAKSEKRLNLCVPGGKETSRMLKQLYQELDGAALVPEPAQPKTAEAQAQSAHAAAPGRSRDNPVYATFLSSRRLNKPGSEKRNLACRHRSCWHRSRLCGRRFLRRFPGQRS